MPHLPQRPPTGPPPGKAGNDLDDLHKDARGTPKRLSPRKMNLHDYEPNFNDITRALFGKDADVHPEPK